MVLDLSRAVVAVDLDDTLYSERDYVLSGKKFVIGRLRELNYTVENVLFDEIVQREDGDWLGKLCSMLELPSDFMTSLLWLYRLHEPSIQLYDEASDVLKSIMVRSVALAVVTDGRGITQRLKLKSLGLDGLPAFVSEEWGSKKPNPERFLSIQGTFPAEHYLYVGDNPSKDFVGPNRLGWTTICLRAKGRNVHSQRLDGLSADALPRHWIDRWQQFFDIAC